MAKATHADRARALMSNYITFNNACQKRSSLLRPVEWVRQELDLSGAMFYRGTTSSQEMKIKLKIM